MTDSTRSTANRSSVYRRLQHGFLWGVVATVIMSLFMLLGVITGKTPFPRPIPLAVVQNILGSSTAQPILMLAAITSHLAYGGFWGALLAAWTRPITLGKGVALGVFLWLIMQIVVLPLLGWGLFGTAITSTIALATLVLHLIYGGSLGLLADRHAR